MKIGVIKRTKNMKINMTIEIISKGHKTSTFGIEEIRCSPVHTEDLPFLQWCHISTAFLNGI